MLNTLQLMMLPLALTVACAPQDKGAGALDVAAIDLDASEAARLATRMLDLIENEVVPKTEKGTREGSKLFGAGIFRKDNLETVIAETNNEKEWPLFHGEVHALKKYWELPRDKRPAPSELIMIATHEPCPLCLSAITWMGIERFYFLFTYEDSRDEFGIPHDFRMLEEIFRCKGGNYAPDNHYFSSASIADLIAKCPEADRNALEARVTRIKAKYDEMSAVYQANKEASDIPLK